MERWLHGILFQDPVTPIGHAIAARSGLSMCLRLLSIASEPTSKAALTEFGVRGNPTYEDAPRGIDITN